MTLDALAVLVPSSRCRGAHGKLDPECLVALEGRAGGDAAAGEIGEASGGQAGGPCGAASPTPA